MVNSFRQNGFSEVNILRSSTALEELMNSSVSNSPLQPLSVIEYSEQAKSNLQLQEVTQVLQFVYTDY